MIYLPNLRGLSKEMDLNFKRDKVPTRDGYGEALLELGKDKRVMVLCADLTESTRVEKFRSKFPAQFIEVGVAEQNLVTVASGLAHVGKIPFVSSLIKKTNTASLIRSLSSLLSSGVPLIKSLNTGA